MKNSTPKLFLSIISLLFASCTVSKESLSGVYIFKDKSNPEFWEAVHLYNDGTFNFEFCNTISPYPQLKGTWQLEGRKVFLTSPDVSVMDNDSLKLKNTVYNISCGNLNRYYMPGFRQHRVLKKIKGNFKRFKFNGEMF